MSFKPGLRDEVTRGLDETSQARPHGSRCWMVCLEEPGNRAVLEMQRREMGRALEAVGLRPTHVPC